MYILFSVFLNLQTNQEHLTNLAARLEVSQHTLLRMPLGQKEPLWYVGWRQWSGVESVVQLAVERSEQQVPLDEVY